MNNYQCEVQNNLNTTQITTVHHKWNRPVAMKNTAVMQIQD